jgi:hypothetical protein
MIPEGAAGDLGKASLTNMLLRMREEGEEAVGKLRGARVPFFLFPYTHGPLLYVALAWAPFCGLQLTGPPLAELGLLSLASPALCPPCPVLLPSLWNALLPGANVSPAG